MCACTDKSLHFLAIAILVVDIVALTMHDEIVGTTYHNAPPVYLQGKCITLPCSVSTIHPTCNEAMQVLPN